MSIQSANTVTSGYVGAGESAAAASARSVRAAENSAPAGAVAQTITQHANVSPTELKRAIDSANNALGQSNAGVEFSIDKNTDQTVVKVVESGTGDVIRQYPSKEAIAIAQAITDLQQQMAQRQSSSQSAGSELKGLLIKQQG